MNINEVSELELFKHYNPFADELPPTIHWRVGFVVERAKHILKGRTLTQLNHALETLRQWRIFSTMEALQHIRDIYGNANYISVTTCQSMYLTRGDFDFTSYNSDSFNQAELFATLAVGKIGAIIASDYEIEEQANEVQSTIIESVDAIGFATTLWIDIVRNRQRSQSQKIDNQNKFDPVKHWLVVEYNELDPGTSNRKAATIIAESMPDDLRYRFSTKDIRDRLAIWIAQYKKGELSGVDDLPLFKSD